MANALITLNDELEKVRVAVSNAARYAAGEYSREAAPARHSTNMSAYRNYMDEVKTFLQKVVSNVEAGTQKPRNEVMPKADKGQELAAELEAARLMGRAVPTDAYALTEFLKASESTPGRTLALEEWQARGAFTGQELAQALAYVYGDIAAADRNLDNARTLVNGYFNPLIKGIEAAMNDYKAVPIPKPTVALDMFPMPNGVFGMAPRWGGYVDERVWAANANA